MTGIDRRSFIQKSALASGLLLAPSLAGLVACNDQTTSPTPGRSLRQARKGDGGYGELRPANGLEGLISIPAGFHAVVLSTAGDVMTDGTPVPYAHDGMNVIGSGSDLVRLVRNHEVRDIPANGAVPFGPNPYDAVGPAGTTTLEVRLRPDGQAELVRQFASLTGTFTNCAGGTTTWNSWLTCEETVAGLLDDEGVPTGWKENHGYVFDVPATANGPVPPTPLKTMGRFAHEAIAVDPATAGVYETKDRTPSGFYRCRPAVAGQLAQGGALEVLAIKGKPQYDTSKGQIPGPRSTSNGS